jgi:hypothetical protein
VRRYEGGRLHPQTGADGVHWFDTAEVAAFASELANEPRMERRLRNAAGAPTAKPAARTADEVAALVFERLDQRQTLAEIVIGVRIAPERVRELYEQWCQGLAEYHLRTARAPYGPLDRDYAQIGPAELTVRLAELPEGLTRISVGRYRGQFLATTEGIDTLPRGGAGGPRSESSAYYGTGLATPERRRSEPVTIGVNDQTRVLEGR